MNDLHFAYPGWMHGLWGLVILGIALYGLDRRSGRKLTQFIGVGLQGSLVTGVSPVRRLVSRFLLLVAGVFLILALMRPQWGVHWVTTPRSGVEIMVCLDVSKSMLAEDVAPNRLERAKAELRDLLPYLHGNQLGLIVFAGRATVLAPLTPDFGFFRLALDQANPGSVSRGGTRLEEPIRKAIAGFGGTGELVRSILLITDGEDQDSFPLEAAKEAAKRGIRILAIGFGDEAGSEIMITDPKTGVRSVLRDQGGNVIKSRLDGQLLREIALITEGAYIPAGVGVLDLKSIYERHIAPLTKGAVDGTRRSIQNDAFQWPVFMGLLALLASVVSAVPLGRRGVGLGILVIGLALSPMALAEEGQGGEKPTATTQTSPAKEEVHTPREDYNLGLDRLGSKDFDGAGPLLSSARDRAGIDVELRVRATYNLGLVEAGRAVTHLEGDPKEALAGFNRAAAWFREAISLRPDDADSRHNLEVVLGRIMALADQLATKGKGDIAAQLEALIEAQRGFLGDLGPVVAGGEMKQIYRDLSARQLEIITQGEDLGVLAGLALETIRKKEEKERTPQEGIRLHQLGLLQDDLFRARERMGQGRGALRSFQGETAFRRGAAALAQLKRGRERLLEWPARLDALMGDSLELRQWTAMGPALLEAKKEKPPWLTVDLLKDHQGVIQERTQTMDQELKAGLESGAKVPAAADPGSELMATLKEAQPLVAGVVVAFSQSMDALNGADLAQAAAHQGEAIAGLAKTRELFLDIKGLLDLAWQDENSIVAKLNLDPPPEMAQWVAALALQGDNLARLHRVGPKIVEQLQQARKAAAPEDHKGDAKEDAAQKTGQADNIRRLEQANELQTQVVEKMDGLLQDLAGLTGNSEKAVSGEDDLSQARDHGREVLTFLDALRQLFFSVEEHLRQVAQKQKDLEDETQALAPLVASPDPEPLKKGVGPLQMRQETLAQTTQAIHDALAGQVEAMKAMPPPKEGETGAASGENDREAGIQRMEAVVGDVAKAKGHMEGAVVGLKGSQLELAQVKGLQEEALKALLDALAKLSPPPPKEQTKPQDPKDDQKGAGGDSGDGAKKGAESKDQQPPQPQSDMTGSRMLQGIRDREAARHRQRGDRGMMNYEPVEKDW
ncbi:MAG: VWA domain-containing protein [Magnetococcales bacterium]|nr:VWA domain-containing protein [Magnetococcales bacterium]